MRELEVLQLIVGGLSNKEIASHLNLSANTVAVHRAYLNRNIAQGRPVGQVRLRLSFHSLRGAWFDLLLFAPPELLQLAAKEGWQVTQLFTETDLEDVYSVVMEKPG